MGLLRSLMFVPGHRARMVDRALGLGEFAAGPLDAAILDLEDGVPTGEKEDARRTVAAALGRAARGGPGPARYVRVNRDAAGRDADLAAIVRPGLDAIVAPKVDHPDELAPLLRALDEREASSKLRAGAVRVIVSIESARGLLEASAIAACSDRVVALLFGAEDFALDLGLPADRQGEAAELMHARSSVVVAAVAAGRLAIDGIWPDIGDAEGLRRDALLARRLGFAGKSLIHPGQIATINEVFSPSAEDVDRARRVIAAFDAAQARGEGAVALDGKLLDPPIVERARRTLRLHEAISAESRTPPVERPAALEGKAD
ncbi:MAG TPA: CoA ester lyase [Candidatus Limnocylindria bacterium]|jgi:citrate lyase beta subunit|nr:CoA ester lyase [Candidatus Limnocylindria bacterium]